MAKTKKSNFSQKVEGAVEELQKKDKVKKSDLQRKAAALYTYLYKEVSEQFQQDSNLEPGGETELDL
jgi:hypothetical protein